MSAKEIIKKIEEAGGKALFIGGFVRDKVLNIPNEDIDIEVYKMDAETLIKILSEFGKVDQVGASFGVIKLTTPEADYDFSLPRRENKTGQGHKGFMVEIDPTITPAEAASRRDFTCNSLAMNPDTGEVLDFFDGVADARNGILRHTSDAFTEDPLRVLRGMQFAGRFGFEIARETRLLIANHMKGEFHQLPVERIWGEFWKWACKSEHPSAGIDWLADTWVENFPELDALMFSPQDPTWHPEGSVLNHTNFVCDQAAIIAEREQLDPVDRGVLVLAALCHDMGKPETMTTNEEGRIVNPKHAQSDAAERFLTQIGCPASIKNRVLDMVREHMAHLNGASPRTVRRLIARMKFASVKDLVMLIEADHSGRPPLPRGLPETAREIARIANEIGNVVKPVLMGRHLIEMGMKPGRTFGKILKEAFEAQLDGAFDSPDGGKAWVKNAA